MQAAVATDVTELSDDELREVLAAYPDAQTSLTAAWAKAVREAEKRQLHQDDGHRSIGAWLRAHTLCSGKQGSSAAWFARRLARLPQTLAALERAEISEGHAKQISFLTKDVPFEKVQQLEDNLVETARHAELSEFRSLIDRLRVQWLPEKTADEREDAYERRSFDIGEQYGGLVPLHGWVDPLLAEKLHVVTNALSEPDLADTPVEDRRTPTQRRHDALDEALTRMLDVGELPTVRREKPHISLTADLQDLLEGTGLAELEWSGPIDMATARMLACDANLHPIITAGDWNPVAIVEDSDTASKKLWRYLRTRDCGCRFPGCDMPAVWCDAHHIEWRSVGGETSNDNCVLLCRFHHRLVHKPARPWTITGHAEGTLTFTSPDHQHRLESAAGGSPRCL